MARIARRYIKTTAVGYYHIYSHLNSELGYLKKAEKEYFLKLIRRLSEVFFIEIISYAIMSNHFHLVIKTKAVEEIKESQAVKRALLLYKERVVITRKEDYWRRKLCDISYFMKELKQRFSQWYNRRRRRRGPVWDGRFKSVRLQKQEAVLSASVYVDLNAVRAGITDRVDGYRWSSYTLRRSWGGSWLLGLSEELGMSLREYGEILEEAGKQEKEGSGKVKKSKRWLILHIIAYKGQGLIYGSEEFVKEITRDFPFRRRKKRIIGDLVIA